MIHKFLQEARAQGASDLHLTVGVAPIIRLQGSLRLLRCGANTDVINTQQIQQFISQLPPTTIEALDKYGEVDCAWSWQQERYRINIFRQQGQYALAIRLLHRVIPKCSDLGLPIPLCEVTDLSNGLVLIGGPTGSGKSTTLAALIQKMNSTRAVHVVTLEDPIEYLYPVGKALIHQREIGGDTKSFASGLRSALREDPDVILVGELRDSETVGIALTAAETGHLVLATLHTGDVVSSINRILDMQAENQQQVRSQLAECLQAVACQRLLPRLDGCDRVAAFELLLATDAVRNLIREGKSYQLQSFLQTGTRVGMLTMEESIKNLRRQGIIK